tara:strand:+ start:1 stop:969 length:969 start_codon:yes stop_codon:yes gene_type:complete
MKKILITGIAGFIGFHLAKKLAKKNFKIIGIDNLNDYYDVNLKKNRLKNLPKISFYRVDINNLKNLEKIFKKYKPQIVINLAAQAGVRYSLKHPKKYLDTNILGFFNILELSRKYSVNHFLFASSSSVYGLNKKIPFKESHDTSNQTNIYGVTKKTNELMAHSYSYLHDIKCIGLRFFTVYGPWGRPDMALFSFVRKILNNTPIKLFNKGNMYRDFTFIDDAVDHVYELIKKREEIFKGKKIKYEIINIAGSKPIHLKKFIRIIEKNLKKKANLKYVENLKTEIKKTHSSNIKLKNYLNKTKKTSLESGIKKFVIWYKLFHK